MSYEPATPVVDYSIASLSGSSQQLFPDVGSRGCIERFVHNCGSGNIGINLTGGTAAIGSGGTITLAAGGSWYGKITSKITVIGTAAQPVTAGQR